MPAELGNLVNLRWLELANNCLTGEIPATLGNLSYLWYLDLSKNRLTGTLPEELSNIPKLRHFNLSHNYLKGYVPASFTKLVTLCVDGQHLDYCKKDDGSYYFTDLGYNFFNVPQPNPPSDFLYEKDPDWDQTQGVLDEFIYFPAILNS